ncbi:hypothetical protein [Fischerella sp. PCC 9605]|uniref:hypothetical protein n=1 Tax=Fischerella sp. PCC 9605 TaxID=1173024 RepID=UPI0004ADF2DD|nr:hypothetical protein [Fischerella sp. PCC 9605]
MPNRQVQSNRQAQSLEERVTELVKRIQSRNLRETGIACILIVIFAFDIAYGISQQREDNLSIIGSGVVIFALLLNITIIWWKLHIPRSEISAFPPTRFPDKWKHHLTNQARMLRLAWLWYLLPLFLGVFIYLLSVYGTFPVSIIMLFLLEIFLFNGIRRLNLQAAKQIERDRDAWFGNSRTV